MCYVLHLLDPICVAQNIDETIDLFEGHPGWKEGGTAIVVSKSGSHCPFYEGLTMRCWAEKVAFEFLDAALARNGARDQKE